MQKVEKYVPVWNEHAKCHEIVMNATVLSIGENIRKNKKETPYQIGRVRVDYPGDGGSEEVNASIWTKSLESNGDAFKAGSAVALRVQVDGEYATYGKIELPGIVRVDMDKLDAFIQWDVVDKTKVTN